MPESNDKKMTLPVSGGVVTRKKVTGRTSLMAERAYSPLKAPLAFTMAKSALSIKVNGEDITPEQYIEMDERDVDAVTRFLGLDKEVEDFM